MINHHPHVAAVHIVTWYLLPVAIGCIDRRCGSRGVDIVDQLVVAQLLYTIIALRLHRVYRTKNLATNILVAATYCAIYLKFSSLYLKFSSLFSLEAKCAREQKYLAYKQNYSLNK